MICNGMALDSQCRMLLDVIAQQGNPQLSAMRVADARAMREAQKLPPGPATDVRDHSIAGPGGALPIREYRPIGAKQTIGALVYFHGGGFVLGSIESHDAVCRQLAVDTGCAVFSVEYRLAPEHKFPSGIDDAVAATRWAHEHAAKLDIDPRRIAVGGDSAGAALATAVAIIAKREAGPAIAFQLLLYPVTDLRSFDTPSYKENAEGYYLTLASMVWFRDHYLSSVEQRSEPLASPLGCTELHGLPPALVITAEHDPLRDEGEAYARALQAAGVRCKLTRYDGAIHAFVSMYAYLDVGKAALGEAAAAVREAIG
jgi:acetyl esterase